MSDLPSFDQYFAPAVASLKKRGGSATIEELEEDVAELLKLSDDVLAVRMDHVLNSSMSWLGFVPI
jgi:hypothetical protein